MTKGKMYPLRSAAFLRIHNFATAQGGGVSVDFVAITSLLVGLGVFVASLIHAGISALSTDIGNSVSGIGITTQFSQPVSGNGSGSGASGSGQTDPTNGPTASPGGSDSNGSGSPVTTQGRVGNPGNNKDVGRAGENPNGQGGFGSGSNGRSR